MDIRRYKNTIRIVMLDFGQDISFVALVFIGMISDLHLGGKHLLRPVRATWPKYAECRFSSVTKSNIVMER